MLKITPLDPPRKVICTNPSRCPMCSDMQQPALIRGRAYTATAYAEWRHKKGYTLAEFPELRGFHCTPHFAEIEPATEDIFAMADPPVIEHAPGCKEKETV